MIVTITQKHINKGRQNNPCWCPFALALKKAGISEVRVLGPYIEYVDGSNCKRVFLTKKACNWIDKFDLKGKKGVQPGQFRILGL